MQPTDHTSTGARVQVSQRAGQQGQGASGGPAIAEGRRGVRTGLGVALEAQHDLRGTVPPRGHVLGHVASILLGVDGEATSQAKIADLELAIGVNEKVTGLQVTVQHVGRMDVLETAQDLVDEGLEVGVGQGLAGANDGRQVAFHKL